MPIYRNKNNYGFIHNMKFGFCNIADGMVRVLSLGKLGSSFAIDCARDHAKASFVKARAALGMPPKESKV